MRRRGGVDESRAIDLSRRVHFLTVVIAFPAVAVVSLWQLPITAATGRAALIQALAVAIAGFAMLALARRVGWTRPQVGTMAIAAAQGNLGFTLGAYLCYTLIEPGDEALAYGVALVSVMQVTGIVLFYPVARHLGEEAGRPTSAELRALAGLVARSLLDVRALMLYGAALGAMLSAIEAPYPAVIDDLYLKDVLFYIGGGMAYFGIGLRLKLGRPLEFLPQQTALAVTRFAFMPLLVLALLLLSEAALGPLPTTARQVLLVEALMPTAIATVMLSNLFRLDAALGSALWFWNTVLFCLVPLPVIVLVLR
jgi:predicted permease